MSVAVLTVFVVPMGDEFGWTRTQMSGAVSLGGVFAVVLSPVVGPLIDRYGSGMVVGISSAIAGVCALGLGLVNTIWLFYLIYVPGRAAFASPLEMGTSTAVSNWFIRRRPFALAINHVVQGSGLAVMPLVAQVIIGVSGNWPAAWYALGIWTLAVGAAPAILLMGRRPEDLGLLPDGDTEASIRHQDGVRTPPANDVGRNQLYVAPGHSYPRFLVDDAVCVCRFYRAGWGVAAPGSSLY